MNNSMNNYALLSTSVVIMRCYNHTVPLVNSAFSDDKLIHLESNSALSFM